MAHTEALLLSDNREQMAAAAARTAEKSAQLATASVEGGYRVPPELEASFGVTSEEVCGT